MYARALLHSKYSNGADQQQIITSDIRIVFDSRPRLGQPSRGCLTPCLMSHPQRQPSTSQTHLHP